MNQLTKVDGVIAMPVAVFGLVGSSSSKCGRRDIDRYQLYFPDLPESTKSTYISAEEVQLAKDRLPPKKENTHSIHWKTLIGRVLTKPHIYILTSFSIACSMLEAFAFQGMFLLWLKHNKSRFNQTAINSYPMGIQAVAIVSQILGGAFIDHTGHRLPMVIFSASVQFVVAVLLLQRNLSDAGTFTAYYLSGTSYIVNPIMYGWASTICQRAGDDAVRSVILYTMSMGGQLLYTWWGIVLYPATDVPYWKKGSIAMVVVCFVFTGAAFAVRWVRPCEITVIDVPTLTVKQLDRTTKSAAGSQSGADEPSPDVVEEKQMAKTG
jgi:ACS family pantothenate transporter-like MFS transporter